MVLAHFSMLVHELLNKYPGIVPDEAPLIIWDSKYVQFMAKNCKYTKHTRRIARIVYFDRNGEK